MSSAQVELTEHTLDTYNVLRGILKDKHPGFSPDGFEIQKDGSVYVTLDKIVRIARGASIESIYLVCKWNEKREVWKMKEM